MDIKDSKDLRKRLPILAAKAAKGQRLACVRLFCIECHGFDVSSARKCGLIDCFLYPARPKGWKESG